MASLFTNVKYLPACHRALRYKENTALSPQHNPFQPIPEYIQIYHQYTPFQPIPRYIQIFLEYTLFRQSLDIFKYIISTLLSRQSLDIFKYIISILLSRQSLDIFKYIIILHLSDNPQIYSNISSVYSFQTIPRYTQIYIQYNPFQSNP